MLLGAGDPAQHRRLITLRAGQRQVALAVEEVLGVRQLPPGQALPPLLGEASADLVNAIGSLDSELLLVLRSARLVPDALWPALQSAGAAP